MSVFDRPDFDEHEEVIFVSDASAGLRGVIAIHDTAPYGMAGGGCRMWSYATEQAGIDDALRLSRAMTFKLALADLPAGGAKMVIFGDSRRDKTEALLEAVGAAIHKLHGRFVVGTDVGTNADDIEVIARRTPYVSRHVEELQDGAMATAYGVFRSIEWASDWHLGKGLGELRVAVQGLGRVGEHLARMLSEAGAELTVSEIDEATLARALETIPATVVDDDAILTQEVDVFAPCALGGVIDDATLPALRCGLVAGAANNPLARDELADELEARGILFVPDFVTNLGGVIGASPASSGETPAEFLKPVGKVVDILDEVYERGQRDGLTLHAAAEALARDKIAARKAG